VPAGLASTFFRPGIATSIHAQVATCCLNLVCLPTSKDMADGEPVPVRNDDDRFAQARLAFPEWVDRVTVFDLRASEQLPRRLRLIRQTDH
jgi:hypothetical protein